MGRAEGGDDQCFLGLLTMEWYGAKELPQVCSTYNTDASKPMTSVLRLWTSFIFQSRGIVVYGYVCRLLDGR